MEQGDWVLENLYVTIKDNHEESRFHDAEALITKVQDGRCQVYIPDLKCDAEVGFDEILPVKPSVGDHVSCSKIYDPRDVISGTCYFW